MEVVKLLIESNSDCNLRQTNGSTPLHVSASNGRHDITQFLINQHGSGVDIFATDVKGHTAIDSALSMGYKGSSILLLLILILLILLIIIIIVTIIIHYSELAGKIAIAQFASMRKDNLLAQMSKRSDF